jgi:hypothetical protein
MSRPQSRRDPLASRQEQTPITGEMLEPLHYNYEHIPEVHREQVRQAALDIKPRLKRAARDIFAVGARLNEVKDLLPHGQWLQWLAEEFDLSDRMARRFMHVAERLVDKSDNLSNLSPSVLYLLAAPSTDDQVIEAIERRLKAGETVAYVEVQSLVNESKKAPAARLEGVLRECLAALSVAEQAERLQQIQNRTPVGERYLVELRASQNLSDAVRPQDLRRAADKILRELVAEMPGTNVERAELLRQLHAQVHRARLLLDQEAARLGRDLLGHDQIAEVASRLQGLEMEIRRTMMEE